MVQNNWKLIMVEFDDVKYNRRGILYSKALMISDTNAPMKNISVEKYIDFISTKYFIFESIILSITADIIALKLATTQAAIKLDQLITTIMTTTVKKMLKW